VKPSGPKSVRGSEGGPGTSDPGRYRFNSASLLDLIALAYNLQYFQISSLAPLDRQYFDFAANVPVGATKEQFRVMLQGMLSERFHLRSHIQSKEFPAYELIVAKGGLKLTEAGSVVEPPARGDGFPEIPLGQPGISTNFSMRGGYQLVRMKAHEEPASLLARSLRTPDGLPVVDKTGLTGKYDFTLEYAMDPAPGADVQAPSDAPALFTALRQQLGLELVRKKVPFDVLIVDSIDKLPAEN
jgi:uncharacterized protein (TIGR03435 family)